MSEESYLDCEHDTLYAHAEIVNGIENEETNDTSTDRCGTLTARASVLSISMDEASDVDNTGSSSCSSTGTTTLVGHDELDLESVTGTGSTVDFDHDSDVLVWSESDADDTGFWAFIDEYQRERERGREVDIDIDGVVLSRLFEIEESSGLVGGQDVMMMMMTVVRVWCWRELLFTNRR
ncbi:hypothetical protein CVT24_002209 [Panaeolus cyanescens]|uniref:Uncharacterized protein n=1 Tax=Panaeolus cyanescens TaxID=181874 RepID=A0A409X4U3_9AGAR|nr:hypothetical protein CVT24_002209 [Panaeolus cyanescens]